MNKLKKSDDTHPSGGQLFIAGNGSQLGYPSYPPGDDIYRKSHEERDINPEDISAIKPANDNDKAGAANEKDFRDDFSGNDLDVPGSELDDERELAGSEDEENNFYSLGGDGHHDLDEQH